MGLNLRDHPKMITPFSVTWPSNKTTITELSGSTFQCQHTWIYLLNVPWNYLNRWYCVLLNSTQVYSGFYNLSVQLILFNIRIPINKSQPIFFYFKFTFSFCLNKKKYIVCDKILRTWSRQESSTQFLMCANK